MRLTLTCSPDELEHLNDLCRARNNGDLFVPVRDDLDDDESPVSYGTCSWDPVAHEIAYGVALEFSDLFLADGIVFTNSPEPSPQSAHSARVVLTAVSDDGTTVVGTRH